MNLNTLKIPNSLKLFRRLEFPKKYGLFDKIYGNILSKNEICWVKTAPGLTWKLDMRMVTHRWIVYGSYDYKFLKWAKKTIQKNCIIVDSGANIGQMTLYFSKWCNEGKILAFEPSSEAANWLSDCIRKNNSLNIEVIQKGLGETESTGILVEAGKEENANLHAFWSFIAKKDGLTGENISITRLDNELKNRNIETVDLWKLDVEGFELSALEGAKELLMAHKIKAIYAELAVKRNNHRQVIEYLSKHGYQCHYFTFTGKPIKSNKIYNYQTDALFLPDPNFINK
jgi:FkbM family methyltransferase